MDSEPVGPVRWSGHPVYAPEVVPQPLLYTRYHGDTLGQRYHDSGDRPADIAKIIDLSAEISQ